ncbi:MAG: sigma factor-like helix-turn-helix DNA-binding protein [Bryobacteraceae bacterium]
MGWERSGYGWEVAADEVACQWHELASAIRRGDPEASVTFSRLYGPGIRLKIRRRMSAVSAERLAAEVIAKAIEDVRGGWIREMHDLVAFAEQEIRIHHRENPGTGGPSPTARSREAAIRMEQVLRALPPQEREAVTLCVLHGKSPEEAAAAAGVSRPQLEGAKARLLAAMDKTPPRKAAIRDAVLIKQIKSANV